MANHKSAIKRIRRNETVRLRNRYYHKTVRTLIKQFIGITKKTEAVEKLPLLISKIDKLAKNRVIHKNKAGNLKSRVTLHLNSLGASDKTED